jgi:hypothetical protein
MGQAIEPNPKSFVITVVQNPDKAGLLRPLLSSHVVAIQGDVSDIDSFPVAFRV